MTRYEAANALNNIIASDILSVELEDILNQIIRSICDSKYQFEECEDTSIENCQTKKYMFISCKSRENSESIKSKITDCFLLSKDEYENYRDKIININTSWRLRSPGYYSSYTSSVRHDGGIGNFCYSNNSPCPYDGVRPALKIINPKYEEIKIGGWTFSKISEEIYLSDTIIFYDYFDEESNVYDGSHIQEKLQNEILPLLQQCKIESLKLEPEK